MALSATIPPPLLRCLGSQAQSCSWTSTNNRAPERNSQGSLDRIDRLGLPLVRKWSLDCY
jgi:hypothetical protein